MKRGGEEGKDRGGGGARKVKGRGRKGEGKKRGSSRINHYKFPPTETFK